MREILFRGNRIDNGEWAHGLLTIMWGQYHIVDLCDENTAYPVGPATIGQYTGLTDKNGAKIFEGDIVRVPFWRSAQSGLTMKGIIEFRRASFSVLWEHRDYGRDFAGYIQDMEVIGNIHDNPELLKDGRG